MWRDFETMPWFGSGRQKRPCVPRRNILIKRSYIFPNVLLFSWPTWNLRRSFRTPRPSSRTAWITFLDWLRFLVFTFRLNQQRVWKSNHFKWRITRCSVTCSKSRLCLVYTLSNPISEHKLIRVTFYSNPNVLWHGTTLSRSKQSQRFLHSKSTKHFVLNYMEKFMISLR